MPLKNITKDEFILLRKKGYSADDLKTLDKTVRPTELQNIINSRSKTLMKVAEGIGQKNLLGKATDLFFGNTKRFGRTIGGALGSVIESKRIDESARKNIESGDKLMSLAKKTTDPQRKARLIKLADEAYKAGGVSYRDIIKETDKSTRQIIGEAIGTGAEVLTSMEGFQRGAQAIKKPALNLVSGLKQGAKIGGLSGGVFGVSGELQKEGEVKLSDVAKRALTSGATGAVIGGAIGGATGYLSNRLARKAEIKRMLQSKKVDPTTTEYKLKNRLITGGNKIVKDKNAKTLISNGLDANDIAIVKTATKQDKLTYRKMFETAKRASEDKRILSRPSDNVGENIVNQVKYLKNRLKVRGNQLDKITEKLKGKQIRFDDAVDEINNSLTKHGVKITKKGLKFDGSDFEGLTSQNRLIDNIYTRFAKSKDAHDLHRLKRYIDTNVSYGKTKGDLTGQAERVIKGWRRAIDQTLDNNFASYNKVNNEYGKILKSLNDYRSLFDKAMNLDELGNQRAGQVARRILGNSANRANIMHTIKNLQNTAVEMGYKNKNDIISQVIFNDILEDIFGTQATTGFQGQIKRALTSVGKTALRGGHPVDIAFSAGDIVRGITDVSKRQKVIEALNKILAESADDISKTAGKGLRIEASNALKRKLSTGATLLNKIKK